MDRYNISFVTLTIILILLSFVENLPATREYVLISIDTERDLVPVLNTTKGLTEGLDYLRALLLHEGVRASFFVTGNVAREYPELVRSLAREGHELCGHAYEHENFTGLSYEQTRDIVVKTIDEIKNASGVRITCFRAPYQYTTDVLLRVLSEQGMTSEGSHDREYPMLVAGTNLTRITSAPLFYPSTTYPLVWTDVYDKTLARQKNNTHVFVVVSLHPWELVPLSGVAGFEAYTTPAGTYTRENLEALIAYAKERGARFITFQEGVEILEQKCGSRLLFCS
ncbi:hypothetical protein COT72_03520 [archaeon CG10_big_fil_rev_8_21_14_0_10_43_11]|nr:MAG: hypothetical protein COT72_03520 [archaeon CG10_big_fil_rev_8_21_14_0_10_43_11]